MRRTGMFSALLLSSFAAAAQGAAPAAQAQPTVSASVWFRVFQVDVTPPVGDFLCGGLHGPSTGVETPLSLRGVVLDSASVRCVVACVDYCYLAGRSYRRLQEALAEGAGVPATHVALHSVHLHDAPLIDEEAHAVVEEISGIRIHDEKYFAAVIENTRAAVREALSREGTPCGGVAFSSARVDRYGSARRVLDGQGKCLTRFSVCPDPALRAAPEGAIDPMLDQVVLYSGNGNPVACLCFYASHPQVSDGRGLISSDGVGVARNLFEQAHPGVTPIVFTGCAGDVTGGKYTTQDRLRNRVVFGTRLFQAMEEAFEAAQPAPPPAAIGWAEDAFDLGLTPLPESADPLIATIRDSSATSTKYSAAMKLARFRNQALTYPFRLARMKLGPVDMLFLPAEMCVEYQLFAKAEHGTPLCVAAYGDGALKYVAPDHAFDEGGYEVNTTWNDVAKGAEAPIRAHIVALLKQML